MTALSLAELQRLANETWREVWCTRIGNKIELHQVKPSGQMIGMLFEEILKHKLHAQDPKAWPLERKKGDKDLHYAPDPRLSIEIKTSGQKGYEVFGNRSYALSDVKDNKAAYFLVINYTGPQLRRVRFGYLTQQHWLAQKSSSGQQCKLNLLGKAALIDLLSEAKNN